MKAPSYMTELNSFSNCSNVALATVMWLSCHEDYDLIFHYSDGFPTIARKGTYFLKNLQGYRTSTFFNCFTKIKVSTKSAYAKCYSRIGSIKTRQDFIYTLLNQITII
jgi:hypothetical protein